MLSEVCGSVAHAFAQAGTRGRVRWLISWSTPAVANLIREGKTHQIHTVMQTPVPGHETSTLPRIAYDQCLIFTRDLMTFSGDAHGKQLRPSITAKRHEVWRQLSVLFFLPSLCLLQLSCTLDLRFAELASGIGCPAEPDRPLAGRKA